LVSDDEIYELENSNADNVQNQSQVIKSNAKTDIEKTQISEDHNEEIDIQEDTKLTALPPKPKSLEKEDTDTEESIKPPPKLKTKAKSKKELKTEKKGLETKLSSVQDLLKFIDKKHSSGKIDDKDYVKRSKTLQNDLKKIKKRIDVLNKLLE
jgi:hypothetical protein